MNSNIFILEFAPFFNEYSKEYEQLFIEAIMNALVDVYGNDFTVEIFTLYDSYELNNLNVANMVAADKLRFYCVFQFKNNIYTLHDFIIKSYEFKDQLSDFIKFFSDISIFNDRCTEFTSCFKTKYKLVVKHGDYIEKTETRLENGMSIACVNF